MVLEDAAHFGEPRIGVLENAAHKKKGTTNCGFGGHRELNCFGREDSASCVVRECFFFFRRGHCEVRLVWKWNYRKGPFKRLSPKLVKSIVHY